MNESGWQPDIDYCPQCVLLVFYELKLKYNKNKNINNKCKKFYIYIVSIFIIKQNYKLFCVHSWKLTQELCITFWWTLLSMRTADMTCCMRDISLHLDCMSKAYTSASRPVMSFPLWLGGVAIAEQSACTSGKCRRNSCSISCHLKFCMAWTSL